MDFTPIPNPFLTRLMPHISDIAELKTTLHVFMSIYSKKGYPRFVSFGELLNNTSLMQCFNQMGNSSKEILSNALESAVKRGTLLHLPAKANYIADIYFLNTLADRKAMDRVINGKLNLPDFESKIESIPQMEDSPDIYTLYEENIGMLTPIIAEELKEAEKLYPYTWIRDAVNIAVTQNKRKWNYISTILERWSTEGRDNGAYRRDSKKEDPDKYIKGKYGHMVRRH
jgi:DnaD/phage-associated family protein